MFKGTDTRITGQNIVLWGEILPGVFSFFSSQHKEQVKNVNLLNIKISE
jgi:hypothetical protein